MKEEEEIDDSQEWINENQSRLFRLDAFLVNFNNLLHKHEAFYKAIAEIRRLCDRALSEYGECEPDFFGGYSRYQWSISRKVGGKMTDEERLVRVAGRRVEVVHGDGLGELGEPGAEGAEVAPSVEGCGVHGGDYSKGAAGAQRGEAAP